MKTPDDVIDVLQISVLLTLNRFHTFLWCIHCLLWTSISQPGQELLQFWPKFESQIQATWLLVKKCVTSCGWVFLNLFSTCFICMPSLDMLSVTSENGSNYFTSSRFKQFLHGEHNVLLTSWCLISKDSGQWY